VHRALDRVLSAFDRLFMAVALLAIFVMMLGISADALSRYAFSAPIEGQYEFTRLYLLVIVTFMALPRTYTLDGHIRLGLLDAALQRIPFALSERLNAVLAAVAFGALAYVSGVEAIAKFANRDTLFGAVQFPLYWSYVWVPLGSGVLTLRLVLEIFVPVRRGARK